MNITVVGCGRWGSCIAWYCSHIKGFNVTLYGMTDAPEYKQFIENRSNEYIKLPDEIKLTDDLNEAINASDVIVVSIGAQNFRAFLQDTVKRVDLNGKNFILCMKGLESSSGKRLTQVFKEEVKSNSKVAVWVGPGHVQDYYAGRPSCMVIDSDDSEYVKYLVDNLNSSLIRFYYGADLIGCEIGAAAKNVIGIAAGMLDGFDMAGLKGALMARGAREVSRLIVAMGGKELTAYGLSHLGDYQATLFSEYSHNRMYGENYIKGIPMKKLAEGVDTSQAMVKLSKEYNVDLPICTGIYEILFDKKDAKEVLENMFNRTTKFEF